MQSADSNKAYDVTGLLEYVTRHPCNQLILTKPMTSQVYRNMLRGIHAIRSKQSLWRHRSIGICYAASMWKSADQRSPLHPDLYRHVCHSLDTPCHDPDHVRISLPMQYMLTTQTGWRPNADQSGGKLNISVKKQNAAKFIKSWNSFEQQRRWQLFLLSIYLLNFPPFP